MSDLSEYVTRRTEELSARRSALLAELEPVEAELRELARASSALQVKPAGARRPRTLRLTQGPGEDSIQGVCLRALRTTGRPMTATEIQGWVSVNLGRDIVRTSLAPQLSRLCFDGRIENVDGRYRVLDAGQREASQP